MSFPANSRAYVNKPQVVASRAHTNTYSKPHRGGLLVLVFAALAVLASSCSLIGLSDSADSTAELTATQSKNDVFQLHPTTEPLFPQLDCEQDPQAEGCGSTEPTPLPLEKPVSPPMAMADPSADLSMFAAHPNPVMPSGQAELVTNTDVLSCLTQRQIAAQVVMGLLTQPELAALDPLAQSGELSGFGFLGTPDSTVGEQIQHLRDQSPLPIWVASDEEGGLVQRFSNALWPIPSAQEQGQSGSANITEIWQQYADGLKIYGVDIVFGPVVDLAGSDAIGNRSYGGDIATVAEHATAVYQALHDAGMIAVMKHFPGHGAAHVDTHIGLAVTPSLAEMRPSHIEVYNQLIRTWSPNWPTAVMVGHLVVPDLTEQLPASLSPHAINGLLRQEMGFHGIVFTDALNMGAIQNNYGALESIEMSLRAGADIALLGSVNDVGPAIDFITSKMNEDATFDAIIRNRAARVLETKRIQQGLAAVCEAP